MCLDFPSFFLLNMYYMNCFTGLDIYMQLVLLLYVIERIASLHVVLVNVSFLFSV